MPRSRVGAELMNKMGGGLARLGIGWEPGEAEAMAGVKTVLVTGSAGAMGRAVTAELVSRGHRVRGFDRVETAGATESIVGSITDPKAIGRAAEGVEALIHLAATPDDDDFMSLLLPNNIVGAYHVIEAARGAGISRLILASSGQVVWWQRFTGPLPIGSEAPISPRGWYAATKVFQEAAGRSYAEFENASVIVARLGWLPRDRVHADELAATDWGPDVYLSPGDAGRFFALCVEAERLPKFSVLYACSKPVRTSYYDAAPARQVLGFEPRDAWPEGAY